MNVMMQSRFGRALYEALPEVYRTRDAQEGESHLAGYLDSCGTLLDAIYNSLDQRYKDCFPDTCQEWLLPYFAQLVGATTLSPHTEGKRKEIMYAVAWHRGKGSLGTTCQIAKEIGGFEKLFVREGWQRVARTARVDGPFVSPEIVDLRNKTPRDFIGHRNTAPHSVDVRKPSWLHGHANPRAVLLYVPNYTGYFPDNDIVTDNNIVRFKWKTKTKNGSTDIDSWFEKGDGSISPSELMNLECGGDGKTWFFYKKPGVEETIWIEGEKTLQASAQYRFSEINLEGSLIALSATYLILDKLAAREVHVRNDNTNTPRSALVANDCLLKMVKASNSLVRLVYCTVLDEMFAEILEASDCIFMDMLHKNGHKRYPSPGEVRYSRHSQKDAYGGIVGNTTEVPVFYSRQWGEPGCGVLHPVSPEAIRHGAEDGGEMGAFHHRAASPSHHTASHHHVCALAWDAVFEKLNDYLPVGMSAALIPDETLLEPD